ncbi:precorrin-3B synthase [Blastococcus sp. MG754426]|uniref:nitrite/sulfite reductase n=1 Tax=unclassified Blastococcus TaxID=2619396 RepID=UPI001EF12F7C|nr:MULTISPECIES: nitrite/sulfite reductase [unclassified Blastococcus]MCF6510103.1 precorrin-3B synthase [Blastococcus sp. MG754426]MCF6514477.1 precorrin-3B synthase [Blastococcus sp. MG754427]
MPSAGPRTPPLRDRADACPGALQTHSAADGELARVRVPGGLLRADQLRVLGAAAVELGDGALELTSRGNVQLRGLRPGAAGELGERLAAAGLLPSDSHETARNLLGSVLSGRAGGLLDARPWVRAFDAGLCADPTLAALPGRFLATFDDGRGDVAALGGDVGLLALSREAVALTLAGADSGLRATSDDAVALALAATRAFLAERAVQGGRAWRLAELTGGPARVTARVGGAPDAARADVPAEPRVRAVGAVPQDDGRTALAAVVPLGRLTAAQLPLLADLAAEVQLTPWRGVVVPDLADGSAAALLVEAGLVLDPGSPWTRVTACAGLPGCAKSLADVRADATAAVVVGALPADGARQHWAGCERRCGRPGGAVVDVVATGSGYRVDAPTS